MIKCFNFDNDFNEFSANTYVVGEKSKSCVIFDLGSTSKKIINFIKENFIEVKAILLTHAHFDHIKGVDSLTEMYSVPVYVHQSEVSFLQDPALNASLSFYETIVCHSKAIGIQEGKLSIGKFDIDVYHTPGHTCGSCCFRIEDHLFSGDTLFQGSIGRMDLPTGSVMQMKESLRKLSALEDDLPVYPGHGPATTIGFEKQWNYEMKHL